MDTGLLVFLVWLGAFVLALAVIKACTACCSDCGLDGPPPPTTLLLLDKVTYARRNGGVPAASTSDGGPTSTTTASATNAGAAAAVSENCVICLGQFEDGDRCSVMPICHHEFHRDCIAKWLAASKNTCPLCRTKLQWSLVAQDMV